MSTFHHFRLRLTVRPEPPRGVDPRTRRYKGRGPAGAGGVVPTGGLAPPRLTAPGFGSGVSAFHHVGERASGRGRVAPASGDKYPVPGSNR